MSEQAGQPSSQATAAATATTGDTTGNGGNSKVAVPAYARSDGTSVSEHTRRPPGEAKRDRQEGEQEEGEGEEEEDKRAKTEGQQQQQQQQPTEQKPRNMSLDDYLRMPWTSQQTTLTEKKLQQSKDPLDIALVAKDTAQQGMAAPGMPYMSQQEPGDDGRVLGYEDFLVAIDKHGDFTNPDKAAVTRNLRSGKYHDGGELGKTCLVPHLHGAGMFELARGIQNGKYKF